MAESGRTAAVARLDGMRLTGRRHGNRQGKTADTQAETVIAASDDVATAADTETPSAAGLVMSDAESISENTGNPVIPATTGAAPTIGSATASDVSSRTPAAAPTVPSAPAASGSPDLLDLIATDPTRLESVVFECLINRLADARVTSLMHLLGWPDGAPCFAIAGHPAADPTASAQRMRTAARDLGCRHTIVGLHDGLAVIIAAVQAAARPETTCTAMASAFAPGTPIALGPIRHGVDGAVVTLHAALHTMTAAPALAAGAGAHGSTAARRGTDDARFAAFASTTLTPPDIVRADDALPERALLGDEDARRELVDVVYASLAESGPDNPTLDTVSTFLFSGGSLENTAKALAVHPNTVRYRLKRAAETTGWDANDPREAYVLRTAVALGRMTVG